MWAKIITIKRTKDLNYFSLYALHLFNTWVSQFELNYWNKITFPRHSNLLSCNCIIPFISQWRSRNKILYVLLTSTPMVIVCICKTHNNVHLKHFIFTRLSTEIWFDTIKKLFQFFLLLFWLMMSSYWSITHAKKIPYTMLYNLCKVIQP